VYEKLEIARQLAKLKVDVIEAGFPVSSPAQFEAVKRIADESESLSPDLHALRNSILNLPMRHCEMENIRGFILFLVLRIFIFSASFLILSMAFRLKKKERTGT